MVEHELIVLRHAKSDWSGNSPGSMSQVVRKVGGRLALGDGTHKLPLKSELRRRLGKEAGQLVRVRLQNG